MSGIHISDLAAPVLTDNQRGARDYGDTLDVDLNRDSILREAEQKTDLSDWGAVDFLQRLDLLVEEWNADRGLNGIGRLSLRNKLLQHATSRLLIQSSVTMLAYGQRMNRNEVLIDGLVDYWSDRIEHLLRACAADRASLPQEQSIDIPFHELIVDDVNMVEKIYNKAGLPMTEQARGQLSSFVDTHKNEYGRVVYDLKGQFGVDPDELRERFDFYFESFPAKRG